MSLGKCPYCKNIYSNLEFHKKHCKKNPANAVIDWQKIKGIGKKTKQKLYNAGIFTVYDVLKYENPTELRIDGLTAVNKKKVWEYAKLSIRNNKMDIDNN